MSKRGLPSDAGRHWDWPPRYHADIVMPVKPKFEGRKADLIIIDEFSDFDKDDWKDKLIGKYADIKVAEYSKKMFEGSFTTAPEPEDSALTVEKLREAQAQIEELNMARKIPKKKTPRGDPRKAKYSGRMFGNILLSATEQITNNTTLNDALFHEGLASVTVEELIKPIFEEFIQVHGNKWQVIGPMTLAAQSVESGKWKSVSALGGEVMHFHDVTIGKRDGICIKWTTGNIVGLDEEMVVDTTIKLFGDKLVPAQLDGNPANRTPLIDILLDFAGEADVVTAAEEAKERVRVILAKQLKDDIERKSEAYGESFGSWA